jgi:ferritin-like metal-binding protein YciE
MPTHSVTYHTGGTAQPSDVVYVDPSRRLLPEANKDLVPGMNGPFIADLLSAFVTHERCGWHLYQSVAARTNNPMLKARYEQFGEETENHIRILEDVIRSAGGDPGYVSPPARAVEKMGMGTLEATFLLSGSLDVMSQEMAMLDAVFLAESMDHANWQNLAALASSMPEGAMKAALLQAVDEVEDQEDEHLEWARTTKAKMASMQAASPTMAAVGAKAEELVEKVRNLFS